MTRYFDTCATLDDLKKAYRTLCKELHPDANPGRDTTALFQDLAAQYEKAFERLRYIRTRADGTTYTRDTTETAQDFPRAVSAIISLAGIDIEICGSFIWVSGDTYTHRATLKALQYRYCAKKRMWYYDTDPVNRARHKKPAVQLPWRKSASGTGLYPSHPPDPQDSPPANRSPRGERTPVHHRRGDFTQTAALPLLHTGGIL